MQKSMFPIGSILGLTSPTEAKIWPAERRYCSTERFLIFWAIDSNRLEWNFCKNIWRMGTGYLTSERLG